MCSSDPRQIATRKDLRLARRKRSAAAAGWTARRRCALPCAMGPILQQRSIGWDSVVPVTLRSLRERKCRWLRSSVGRYGRVNGCFPAGFSDWSFPRGIAGDGFSVACTCAWMLCQDNGRNAWRSSLSQGVGLAQGLISRETEALPHRELRYLRASRESSAVRYSRA